jgi:hypothetical protein
MSNCCETANMNPEITDIDALLAYNKMNAMNEIKL